MALVVPHAIFGRRLRADTGRSGRNYHPDGTENVISDCTDGAESAKWHWWCHLTISRQ